MKIVAYAVKVGREVGIFSTWPECQNAVKGYTGAVYRGFSSRELAEAWLGGTDVASYPKTGFSADGGCKKNPGRMVWKVYSLAAKKLVESSDNAGHGTNNQAEIIAVGRACAGAGTGETIYTDSKTALAWINGSGNPTVPESWLLKIRDYITTKKLVLVKWDKEKWGECPSDCK